MNKIERIEKAIEWFEINIEMHTAGDEHMLYFKEGVKALETQLAIEKGEDRCIFCKGCGSVFRNKDEYNEWLELKDLSIACCPEKNYIEATIIPKPKESE